MNAEIHPPKTLLMAASGGGKSFSLATLPKAGIETFVIGTEPDFTSSLLEGMKHYKADMNLLHWATVTPVPAGWQALEDMVQAIGTQGFQQIQDMKSGIAKDKTREPAGRLLHILKNFHCERTNKDYGDVFNFDDTKALVLDSLTGLNILSQLLTVGYKPAMHMGEWSVAMNFIEQVLIKLTTGPFWFVMTAHVEKEMNEITGVNQVMASTLGKKLAPKLGRFFSDSIYAKRLIAKDGKALFEWNTLDVTADLKNRFLPPAEHLQPNFEPILREYRARKAAATPAPVSQGTAA